MAEEEVQKVEPMLTETQVVDVSLLFRDYLLKHEPSLYYDEDNDKWDWHRRITSSKLVNKRQWSVGFKHGILPWLFTQYSEVEKEVSKDILVMRLWQLNENQNGTYDATPDYSARKQTLHLRIFVYEGEDKDYYAQLYERLKDHAETYANLYNQYVENWITVKITKSISLKQKLPV